MSEKLYRDVVCEWEHPENQNKRKEIINQNNSYCNLLKPKYLIKWQ